MVVINQVCQALLNSVAVGSGQFDDLGDAQAAVLLHEVDDLDADRREFRHQQLFAFHLDLKARFLLLQRPQEKTQPRLPVGRVGADRALGAAQGEVVTLLALLDHTFQRAVWNIFVAAAQQEQRCQDT